MKEFSTAVREAATEESQFSLEFKVDGRVCRAAKPRPEQLAVAIASTGRGTSDAQQIAGIINFFVNVLDEATHAYLVGRLLDPRDDYGLEQVEDVMEWMIEEWTGNPTQPPSVSTPSQPPGGESSTPVSSTST